MPSTVLTPSNAGSTLQLAPELHAGTVCRRFSVPPDTAYILDCAVELGEITPLEGLTFQYDTAPGRQLQALLDNNERLPEHWLRNTANAYLQSLRLEERYLWVLRAQPAMQHGIQLLRERICFVVQRKVQTDLGVVERNRSSWLTESCSPKFRETQFANVHDVTQSNVQSYIEAQFQEARTRLEDELQLLQQALSWVAQAGNINLARELAARFFKDSTFKLDFTDGVTVQFLTRHVLARESQSRVNPHKTRRHARSAIKKALKLSERTGMADSVHLLVQGEQVELSHSDSPFKFVVEAAGAGWLEQNTIRPGAHVPYHLSLKTKEGLFLTRLCVLFDQSPVLDQLLGLGFFVRAGCEEDILMKANWFGYENSATLREYLQAHAPQLLDKVPAPRQRAEGVDVHWSAPDRAEEHWAPFKQPVMNWIASWFGVRLSSLEASQNRQLAVA